MSNIFRMKCLARLYLIFLYLIIFLFWIRYFMIKYPMNKAKVKPRYMIICSIFLGFIWSVLPLIGWSRYSKIQESPYCSIEMNDRSLNVISYNITVFIFVFLLPFGIIFVTSYKIVSLVRFWLQN